MAESLNVGGRGSGTNGVGSSVESEGDSDTGTGQTGAERGLNLRKESCGKLCMLYKAIERHERGEPLIVPGIGEFKVEWHATCDLKTLKLLLNIASGANSAKPNVYSMRERVKGKWADGARSGKQSQKPVRDVKDPRFNSLLPIPLGRIHVCSMHGHNRMTEMNVHQHVKRIWNMDSSTPQKKAIRDRKLCELEGVLSKIGVQGGHCKIVQDPQAGKGNMPQKISFKDTTARKFSSKKDANGLEIGQAWTGLVNIEPSSVMREKMTRSWLAFEKFSPYLTDQVYSVETGSDPTQYDKAVDTYLKWYNECWGEAGVTHYMVRLASRFLVVFEHQNDYLV
jgi:hypothetical protein